MVHRPTAQFPAHLTALYNRFPVERSLGQDPLSCVRPFADDPRSAEVAGIFAATLAIGNTTMIRRSFGLLVDAVGGNLRTFVDDFEPGRSGRRVESFRHRWIRGEQLAYLAGRLHDLYTVHPSLEDLFLEGSASDQGFAGGLDQLARGLRAPIGGAPAPRGYDQLFPSPLAAGHSACKRLALYVRWMVRREYPDLGVWRRVPVDSLRVPLDQHVFWIAYHLGLTHRRTRNWAAVEEVTAALRRVDPADPVKFDFVLCHTGISGDCPKTRDMKVCGPCVVRPDCLMWRGKGRAS